MIFGAIFEIIRRNAQIKGELNDIIGSKWFYWISCEQGRPAKIRGPVPNFNLGPNYNNNITKIHFIATSIKYVNIMIVYVALTHFFNVLC